MSIQEISNLFSHLSSTTNYFPIPDLTNIILEYVCEFPTSCFKTICAFSNPTSIATFDNDHIIAGTKNGQIAMIQLSDEKQIQPIAQLSDTIDRILVLKNKMLMIAIEQEFVFIHHGTIIQRLRMLDECGAVHKLKEQPNGSIEYKTYVHQTGIIEHTDQYHHKCLTHCPQRKIQPKNNEILVSGILERHITIRRNDKPVFIGHHSDVINDIIKLRDGSIASIAGAEIKIWEFPTFMCVRTLKSRASNLRQIIELKNGTLVTMSYDGLIEVW